MRGTVHITVLEPGGTGNPAVGSTVVFIDADGTISKKTTDTAGKTSADLLPGANVTSVVLAENQYTMQTVLGLKPADDITLGAKSPDTTSAGTLTVTVPQFGNSTSYEVSTPCGQNGAFLPPAGGLYTASIVITNDCKKSPFEMVVVALDGTGAAASSIDIPSVSFSGTATYNVTGAYTGTRTVTSSYTNVNPVVSALRTSRVSPDAAGVALYSATLSAPPTTTSTTVVGGLSSTAQIITTVFEGKVSTQTVRQPLAGTATTYGLDLGATLLPWIGKPSYDAANTKVVVPVDTTGTTNDKPDLYGVQLAYVRTDANQTTTSFTWQIYGQDIGDVVLPALPADLGPLLPLSTDTVSIRVGAFDAVSLAGYDAVRSNTQATFSAYTSNTPPDSNIRLTKCVVGRTSC